MQVGVSSGGFGTTQGEKDQSGEKDYPEGRFGPEKIKPQGSHRQYGRQPKKSAVMNHSFSHSAWI
jgi:hypothetical protein